MVCPMEIPDEYLNNQELPVRDYSIGFNTEITKISRVKLRSL